MAEPLIYAHDLKVVYNVGKSNEYLALRVRELEIYQGEYIILFGPSGCGKSTLLYCLLGVLPPTSGELIIKSENPYKYDWRKMVNFQRNTIGIIYQSFNLIPSISVLDNVALPRIFANDNRKEREYKAMEVLKRFGVEKQAKKFPTSLSGGQMQRIAVSRSLVSDPEILLADEPVGNLDAVSTKAVMDTLMKVNTEDKKTVILVTHDARHLPYAHRVYHMKEGFIEREVVNPERPQIKKITKGKTIMTEVEKLARLYPYAEPGELRIMSIINYLTQDVTFEQIERLGKIVEYALEGRVTDSQIRDVLVAKFSDGGVEIPPAEADVMVRKLHDVVERAMEVRRFRQRNTERVFTPSQDSRVQDLRRSLLDAYAGQVSEEDVTSLESMISMRIAGLIQMEEFEDFLSRSHAKNGLDIESHSARALSRYLEKMIAQATHL
jgi:ABC-type lipoprotein export system ATPase subunit